MKNKETLQSCRRNIISCRRRAFLKKLLTDLEQELLPFVPDSLASRRHYQSVRIPDAVGQSLYGNNLKRQIQSLPKTKPVAYRLLGFSELFLNVPGIDGSVKLEIYFKDVYKHWHGALNKFTKAGSTYTVSELNV